MEDDVLELPPIPGTDEAHPRFEINWRGSARMDASVGDESYKEIYHVKGNIIAAAAISKLWSLHEATLEPDTAEQYDALVNERLWEDIVLGSRDHDNKRIIAYQPRGKK